MILTLFYRLLPTLIEEGKVFIAETPLFEINTKNETFFAYDEREKREIISTLDERYSIQRSKGLGENEPEMMWKTTMSPDSRRLIKVVPESYEETKKMFDTLLGKNLSGRKKFISEFGSEYIDMLDLS